MSSKRSAGSTEVKRSEDIIKGLQDVLSCELDAFCDTVYAKKPNWVVGSLSRLDARFLFRKAATAGTSVAVEVGTASGFSTAFLCYALNALNRAGAIGPEFAVVSYDIASRFYADREKEVGDAAREILPPSLLEHISFRNPATAVDLRDSFAPDQIQFLFLDANHRHPWPTLDLLAALDCLSPAAVVVLHDINLPICGGEDPGAGAKYLFDGLDTHKETIRDEGKTPNIGSMVIPDDKELLRHQLLEILYSHKWETNVNEETTTLAFGTAGSGGRKVKGRNATYSRRLRNEEESPVGRNDGN